MLFFDCVDDEIYRMFMLSLATIHAVKGEILVVGAPSIEANEQNLEAVAAFALVHLVKLEHIGGTLLWLSVLHFVSLCVSYIFILKFYIQ